MMAGDHDAVSRPGDARSPGAALPAGLSGRGAEIAAFGGASPLGSRVPVGLSHRTQNRGPSDARSPKAQYTAHNLRPAYVLRYDWTGWPTAGTTLPAQTAGIAWNAASAWEADGLRLHELRAAPQMVQLLFSVTPQISPVFFCQRAKGRLQHALRRAGTPIDFSRKVSFRSLGENTSGVVEGYIRGQVGKEDLADPRFREIMRRFTVTNKDVRLAEPSESKSGRYWYNLHVVLVAADRFRITNPEKLGQIRNAAFAVAADGGHRIATLSVMPDHVHIAIRGNIEQSPEQIALAFQNGLAHAAGCRAWQDGFYVGTFSEYDLDVVRKIADKS